MSVPPAMPAAGVPVSEVQLPPGNFRTVLEFLSAHFPQVGARAWRSRMERGLVSIDRTPVNESTPYRVGLTVRYYRELPRETHVPFEATILHEDEHLLVADKPHFLPVIPSGRHLQETLLVRLKQRGDLDQLVPLHRIDRGTAGVVMFSKSPETRTRYQQLFPRREVRKVYEALAPALPHIEFPVTRRSRIVAGEPFFRQCEVPGEPNSETLIERIDVRGDLTLYRLQPHTGRTHQLRVHLAALGAPIVNDDFYPELRMAAEDDFSRPLQLLARSIEFNDPLTGAPRHFASARRLTLEGG